MNKIFYLIAGLLIAFVLITEYDALMRIFERIQLGIGLILLSGILLLGGYLITALLFWLVPANTSQKTKNIILHGIPWIFPLSYWIYVIYNDRIF